MTRIVHGTGVGVTHWAGDGLSEFPSDLADVGTAGSAVAFSVQASATPALVTLASCVRGSDALVLPMRVLVAGPAAAVADSMIKSVASRGPPSIVGLPAKLRWGLRAMMRCRLRDRLARARRRLTEVVALAITSITRGSTSSTSRTSRAAASQHTGSTARTALSHRCRRPRPCPPVTVSAPPARRFI